MKSIYSKITLFSFLLGLLFACQPQSQNDDDEKTTETKDTIQVKVEEVVLEEVSETESFAATVESNKKNNITPNMPGRIRKIFVDVGSFVRRGQIVVQMDESSFSQQKIQIETLKKDIERYQELYKVGGVSKQQLEQLESQLKVAKTSLASLQENTRLVSPISGVVTARNFENGDMGSGMPILTIENSNPVKLKINVSEKYYTKISKGMKAMVQLDALKGKVFDGKVSLIHPKVDPATHTFPVEVSVANPNRKILSGMYAEVTLLFSTELKPVIKDMAVQKQVGTNRRYVFVVEDGKAKYTNVTLGKRIDDKYEIISGVKEGDKVVVEGTTKLLDEDIVEIVL